MISIIVCSKDSSLFSRFSYSVSKTIGVEFEIIRVDNTRNKYSIAEAYNQGASQAKFNFLIFSHEDVDFQTFGWGEIILDYFKSLKSVGVIGIAGSSYLPISPSDWWVPDKRYLYMNFFSNDKERIKGKRTLESMGIQDPQPVYALDGVFLALEKKVYLEFPFDESLRGFQGYDTSICLRVSQKHRNYFVPGILLEHFSKGYANENWLKNTIQANHSILPFILQLKRQVNIDRSLEIKAYHLFLNQLKKYSANYKFSLYWSTYYLREISKIFFSSKVLFLWLAFQFAFLIKNSK